MRKCREATTKENLLFQHKYCESRKAREKLVEYFKVTVEAYEELPPWYSTFSADGSDIRLKDDVIMFSVKDLKNLIVYYPVFSAEEGLRLLKKWGMEIPPKMTAFAYYHRRKPLSPDNAYLRSLIAFSRLFMLYKNKQHPKMAFGFNNLYKQLWESPSCTVSVETVKFINEVVGGYLKVSEGKHFGNCRELREFIAYVTGVYSLLNFCESDFAVLRDRFKQAYPDEKIYF